MTTGSPARLARWNESSVDKLGSFVSQRETSCPRVPVNWAAEAVAKSDNATQNSARILMSFIAAWRAFGIGLAVGRMWSGVFRIKSILINSFTQIKKKAGAVIFHTDRMVASLALSEPDRAFPLSSLDRSFPKHV